MSFIDSMTSIASNLGSKLVPANTDAIRGSLSSLSKHSKSANIYKKANREGRTLTDNDFAEKAQDAAQKALEYEYAGKDRKARRKSDEAAARLNVSTAHQTALGRAGGAARDGSKLDDLEKLKKFRSINNNELKEHAKGIKDARKELLGHAKDYYFSGDLGTNAARWGATAGAYGAAAVGTRYMTGGTATTNNRGQRDIAGIPFI